MRGKSISLSSITLFLLVLATLLPFWEGTEGAGINEGTVRIFSDPADPIQNGNPVHDALPGEATYFNLFFRNTHTSSQEVLITITDGPSGWSTSINSTIDLGPGDNSSTVLAVNIPDETMDPDGRYYIRVEAIGMETGDTASIIAVVRITASIEHDLLLLPSAEKQESMTVFPGQKLYFKIGLYNRGDMRDIYTLRINDGDLSWDISFSDGLDEMEVELAYGSTGSSFVAEVLVEVPPTVETGQTVPLTIHSTSKASLAFEEGKASSQITVQFRVIKGASISLEPLDPYMEVEQGGGLLLRLDARHTGVRKAYFTPVVNVLSGSTVQDGFGINLEPAGRTLFEIDETKRMNVEIVPPLLASGMYIIQYGGHSDEAKVTWATSTLKVLPVGNVGIYKITGGPFNRTDDIELEVELENLRQESVPAMVSVSGAPNNVMLSVEPPALTIGASASATVTVALEALDCSTLSRFTLEFKLLIPDESDPDGWRISSNRTQEVVFFDRPNLIVLQVDAPIRTLEEGEWVEINVTVANNGYSTAQDVNITIFEVTTGFSRVWISSNHTTLLPGQTLTVRFTWRARPSAKSIRAVLDPMKRIEEDDEEDNELSKAVWVTREQAGGEGSGDGEGGRGVPPGVTAVAVGGAVMITISLLAVISSDAFRYPVFGTLFPLYSKLRPQHLLNNRLRRRIYVHIQNHPGDHFRGILVNLNLTNGTLAHHLYTLEKEKLIRSERDGLYRRFYPAGYRIESDRRDITLVQRRIHDLIQKRPGTSQKEIADELKLSSSTVNYNVKSLKDKGLIEMKKSGKSTQIYPVEENS